ncbi:TPA: type II toxin-antitoxin system YafQ family toxin [Campylobacter fetus subsp. venerealis]|uniref:type II toxin-antitoxin system YafQ family toxin n=1 Tax=Campylobacter fetus TaxID=196 RepID=UPI00190E2952|nr:type II toxin-antitoxin system YafQ family toxin [Campylobacter fetus]MBK3505326.1 type II toxin-antitoxin system YafQ family toxin [Campylobacter fetus subsp. venerealis]HDX6248737.1 type II toxin-antitoxin system YafQ family toxin [Campylobacter fetus subsp. venerealis]HDX6254538.1 type II toxin-antitoxin system YafQ family toxin [Campylobacter fetus subsp. venerealis]HDX6258501.1 type II toxin-antitoxin system YafQ family toxin [Campylobacter fetus subsp. venerealis]HDX6262382.1 type II 
MKYTIELSNRFKKSFKKLNTQEQEIFKEIVDKLANDEILDPKYKDHSLSGNFKNFRECHLKPDLLLIYQKQKDTLILYCLDVGSHSKLFK